ncbi:MAG: hypothetical protein K6U79_10530 [Firmicutes bacterium]|nr:hypothetical protein [Bacillota bacterium]
MTKGERGRAPAERLATRVLVLAVAAGILLALLAWPPVRQRLAGARPAPAAPGSGAEAQPPRRGASLPYPLDVLAGGGWSWSKVKGLLPPVEASYQDRTEGEDFVELAASGGALRLYLSEDRSRVLALLADTSDPRYAGLARLGAGRGPGYAVWKADPLVVVVADRPLSRQAFAALVGRTWSPAELEARLGAPSFRSYVHGLGATLLTFLPQGLRFAGGPAFELESASEQGWPNGPLRPGQSVTVGPRTYADYLAMRGRVQSQFARDRFQEVEQVRAALARGLPSPGGRYRAALLNGGVYWEQWILVGRPGQAELRLQAGYFVGGLAWLDDRTLVYDTGPGAGTDFVAVELPALKSRPLGQVKEMVRSFYVLDGRRIRYQTTDGLWRTLTFEPAGPPGG